MFSCCRGYMEFTSDFSFLIMAHASSGTKGAIFSDMKCIAALNNLLFETKMDIVIV